MTGGVIETFETPYTKSQMIGGRQPVRKGSQKCILLQLQIL